MSDCDNIILESLALAKGVSIEEIKESLNTKKKRKRKKRKKTEPTVQLHGSMNAKEIAFTEVKGRIRKTEPKENVFEWTIRDVALYTRLKYQKMFDESWKHNIIGVSSELRRLHDRILDIYGHCDFLVLRDYIDYIFEEKINIILDKANGVFYLQNFRNDQYIIAFSNVYDYQESFQSEITEGENDNNELENISMSNNDIEEVFLLSEEIFVKTYGIVVPIFWLIKSYGYSNKEASMRVLQVCKNLHKKGEFKEVKEKTELLSPYHQSIYFPKMVEFLKNIDGRYKIDIEYKEHDIIKSKFKFLEETE